jgi:hypothetical protein
METILVMAAILLFILLLPGSGKKKIEDINSEEFRYE